MRFSDVVRGVRAVRPVTLRLPDGRVLRCGVRPLHPDTEVPLILAEARHRARNEEAKSTAADPIYEHWLRVLTLARACVDLDTAHGAIAEGGLAPFFDGGPEQIRAHLDGEAIRRLYEAQVGFQIECLVLEDGDVADKLLGLKPNDEEILSPQVVAAEFAEALFAYYGQPGYTLTSAQILLWLSLKTKYRKRFGASP